MTMSKYTHIDPLFKQILVLLGKSLHFIPQTEVEVSRLPRTIDVVVELPNPADQRRLERLTPFIRLCDHNQIEFKGKADRLHIPGYQLIRGRSLLYMGEKQLLSSQMSVSIVCAGKPTKLLQGSEAVFKSIAPGYYLGDEKPPTLIIVINELPMIPKNYPLLLFASSKRKFCQFLHKIMADTAYHVYLQYAYIVRPTITKEQINMHSAYITEENLAFIVQDIGDQLMPLITDKAMLQKSPAFHHILVAEREKHRQLLLEKEQQLLLEKEQLLSQQEEQLLLKKEQQKEQLLLEKQRTLLRLLRRRFSVIPESLVQRIEATTDHHQLEQWLDKLFDVNDIAEFDRLTHPVSKKTDPAPLL